MQYAKQKYFKMKKFTITLFMMTCLMAIGQNGPIDFEDDGIGADWTWTVFENESNPDLEIIDNPDPSGINTSDKVAQFTALEAGQPFAGCESQSGGMDLGPFTWDDDNRIITIMVWKSEISNVGIKFANPAGWAQPELLVSNTVTNEWEELTFDFSDYINPPDGEGGPLDQIIVFPDFQNRDSDNVVYFDNISFGEHNDNSEPGDEEPMEPAPTPTEDEEDVYSLFSNAYTDNPVDTWLTEWSQAQLEDLQIQGVDTKRYFNLDFAGAETFGAPVDATEYDFFHVDVWSNNAELFRVKLANFIGEDLDNEGEIAFEIANNEWVSLEIPLADFADADLVTDPSNLLTNRDAISQIIFSGTPTGSLEVYIDNVYFSKESLSSEEFEAEVGFSMYPNPARNVLTIESKLQVDEVKIFDISGRLVKSVQQVNTTLDISDLKDGVYMVSSKIGDHMVVRKLIKQ